jgi:hypothetical protein
MRIPFPTSIPFRQLLVFLTVMLFIQLVQGTDPVFAALMVVAQVAAIAAFNRMGGMTHMAGAFCLFAILPNVTIPELTHIVLGQPGDYNLENPLMTAGACAVFFVCVMSASILVSLSRPREAFIEHISFSILELKIISALASVIALCITFAVMTHEGPLEDGTMLTAAFHFQAVMLAISIMMATYVRLTVTEGRSAMSWYIALLLILGVTPGILGASKEGMLIPILCWVVVVAALRHRFTRIGVLALLGLVFLLWTFVYPFSQNARFPVRDAASIQEKVGLVVRFVQDPSQFPDSISTAEESDEFGTESAKVNILKRYSQLQSIDMLIGSDLRVGYTSIERHLPVLLSVVPHAIWPDRPVAITSNELGHKAGYRVSEEDTTTGLSIGAPALFFDLGGWLALVVYTIVCFFLFFLATVKLVGKSTSGVWALVPIGTEGNVAGVASPSFLFSYLITFMGMFVVVVAILKIVSYITQSLISRPVSSQA